MDIESFIENFDDDAIDRLSVLDQYSGSDWFDSHSVTIFLINVAIFFAGAIISMFSGIPFVFLLAILILFFINISMGFIIRVREHILIREYGNFLTEEQRKNLADDLKKCMRIRTW